MHHEKIGIDCLTLHIGIVRLPIIVFILQNCRFIKKIMDKSQFSRGNHDFSQEGAQVLLVALRLSVYLRVQPVVEDEVRLLLEDDGVGRASELEVADFLPLRDHVAHLHCRDAAGHLRHADVDDGDLTDVLVARIDHHDLARSHCAQEGLTLVGRGLVVGDELRLVQVIGARDLVYVLDDAVDGRVPPMVEERAQEGLIDGASLEQVGVVMLLEPGGREHVAEGVDVVLEPKVVRLLHVRLRLQGEDEGDGLAGVDDDVVGVRSGGGAFADGPKSGLELSEEPFVPVLEAVVRQLGGAGVLVVLYLLARATAEPTVGLLLVHEFQRRRRKQHLLIVVQNVLQVLVHAGVAEEGAAVLVLHELHEDRVYRKSHEFVVGVARRSQARTVDHPDHVFSRPASELSLAARDPVLPVEPEDGVGLDEQAQSCY